MRKHQEALLTDERVALVTGDGRLGYPPGAPYDVIHVGAAFSELPRVVLEQLRVGGMIVSPVGRQEQALVQVVREGPGTFTEVRHLDP